MGAMSHFQVEVIPCYGRFLEIFPKNPNTYAFDLLERIKDHYGSGNWEVMDPHAYFGIVHNLRLGKFYDFINLMETFSADPHFLDVDFRIVQVLESRNVNTYRFINGKCVQKTEVEVFPHVEDPVTGVESEVDPSWFSTHPTSA